MARLLGIDVGTTNIKICVYDENGESLFEGVEPTPFTRQKTGGEYDPNEILKRITAGISGLDDSLKSDIIGLSVSSFAETMVGVDTSGRPVCGGIAWFDTRTEIQFQKTQSFLDTQEVYEHTGLIPHHIYSFYKMLWHRENNKKDFKRVQRWMSISGYILFALSGVPSFDFSLASRTMFFDQKTGAWWDRMLEYMGIEEDRLAELVPSGTVLGNAGAHFVERAGLDRRLKVVTGGHDHLCAALATGVFQTGSALISTGTTESLTLSLDRIPDVSIESMARPFWWGHHTAGAKFYALNGIYSGGFTVDWLLKILEEEYDVFDRILFSPDTHVPFFVPYLRGGDYPQARGAILNLDGSMGREQLLQGAIIGLCFEMRFVWDEMIAVLKRPVVRVVNAGGGANNRYWMKMKAAVLGHAIEVPADREGSAKGAALLAGMGAFLYRDAEEAYTRTFKIERKYLPSAKFEKPLADMYATYVGIIEDVKHMNMKFHTPPSPV